MQSNWIFQLNKTLNSEELIKLQNEVKNALTEWNAHGAAVLSEVQVHFDRFLEIKATNFTSGCSIDWMNKTINDLILKNNLSVLTANFILVEINNKIEAIDFRDVEKKLIEGFLTPQTMVYDLTAFLNQQNWHIPLEKSWLNRFIPVNV